MKFNSTNRNDITESVSYTNYSGVGTFKLEAFNPSAEEISKITGRDLENVKEKHFIKQDVYKNDNPVTRLHFLMSSVEEENPGISPFFTDVLIDISPKDNIIERDNDDNTYFFTTNKDTYKPIIRKGSSMEDAKDKVMSSEYCGQAFMLDEESFRIAKVGEITLNMFFAALAGYSNSKIKDEGFSGIEDWNKLCKGNFKEITDALKDENVRTGYVKLLIVVEDDKYMKAHDRFFTNYRATQRTWDSYLQNARIKGEFQSFENLVEHKVSKGEIDLSDTNLPDNDEGDDAEW